MCQNHTRRAVREKGRRRRSALGALKTGGAAAAPTRAAAPPGPVRVFDAHLHCPAESGELWQWHTVTRNFDEFVAYLDKTGVERGIINSQRSQEKGTPAEFVAGNREVARFVEKHKGRFVGACVVNPQFIDEALKEVEYCRKQLGFVWVGELCNYMAPYEYTIKEFELLVKQVVKLGMVLDVHTENEEIDYIVGSSPRRRSSSPTSATRRSTTTSSSGSTSWRSTRTATWTPRATATTAWACWSTR